MLYLNGERVLHCYQSHTDIGIGLLLLGQLRCSEKLCVWIQAKGEYSIMLICFIIDGKRRVNHCRILSLNPVLSATIFMWLVQFLSMMTPGVLRVGYLVMVIPMYVRTGQLDTLLFVSFRQILLALKSIFTSSTWFKFNIYSEYHPSTSQSCSSCQFGECPKRPQLELAIFPVRQK